MVPEPLRLKDAFKQYKHDQDKIITPEKTVERFKQRLADNKLDILDDIVRVDKGRLGIPVYFSVCGPQARAAILRLTGEETATELRSLSITPKALLWQSRYLPVRAITPENVRTWVSDLSELARIAQDLTPPTVAAVESTLEQNIRLDRSKYTGRIIGITCGIIGLMTACMVGVSILLIFLTESGM